LCKSRISHECGRNEAESDRYLHLHVFAPQNSVSPNSKLLIRAFSSEVDTGSRQDNASEQNPEKREAVFPRDVSRRRLRGDHAQSEI
jgi:hypothetical protein